MPDFQQRFDLSSLTLRVAFGVTLLLVIGGLLVSIAAFAYGREAARSAYDRLLLGAANDIASSIAVQDGRAVLELRVSAFELLALAPDDRIGYRIIGPDGTTLTGYDEIVVPAERRNSRDGFFDSSFFGEEARFAIVTKRFAERTLNGTMQVIVGQTLKAREAMAYEITRQAVYVLIISGFAMALLATVVVRSVLRPLKTIAGGLRARDPHDLTPLNTAVPKETAVMIQALNAFMARLDRQMNSMRHLISDTAHQLRTPVAALRAQADLLADEADPERRERIAERIQSRSEGLGRLLDQLLSQALVVHRGDSARREDVDLRDIALEVFEEGDHRLLFPQKDVSLDVGDVPLPVFADAPSLAEALKNLLSNALKYGKAPIVVGASKKSGTVFIYAQDAGEGPDPETLSLLGERFSNDTPTRQSGSGLGLAIAHSVACAFGGTLELARQDGGGFRAALVFKPDDPGAV
ncbi:two-component system sensor histidine kinase TctE [Roseibium hamelinense]|uniref:histidine kinase n=1 Tax=Roseibium hamelinense TaxID=150831 RepID=A0A562SXT1_9HYPH|nr:sensor histidine kinase [Roseibium hamelinense]MTI44733.1 sensor histidine kinase [Roseibium hamelinense]TWI86081.1 two-component system sensor histidine kinase TctE [Roseibium hamelinense]